MQAWLKISVLPIFISLTGCHLTTIAPVDQVQKNVEISPLESPTLNRTVAKRHEIAEYHCENHRKVRIQSNNSKHKNKSITLTFNQRSHKLSPMISEQGKKYTNLRWTWVVDFNGTGRLINNQRTILAKNCMKEINR